MPRPAPPPAVSRIPRLRGPVTAWPIRCSAAQCGCALRAVCRNLNGPSLPVSKTLGLWAALLAASGLLSYGLTSAHFPAALLLGPMLAAIVFGVRGAPLRVPKPAFQGAQALIGCLVAHAINAEIAGTILDYGFLILLVVLVTVLAGGIVGYVLTRMRVLPGTTAAWGSS